MAGDVIRIRDARQHNLCGVDVDLPKQRLVAVTGVSGSGKSTLAYDTLFAEGQRRFLESLSPQARQFLHQLPRPKVRSIDGLTPTLAIGQERLPVNPRATLATITDCQDYLRLLWARCGETWCPSCQIPVRRDSPESIADWVAGHPAGTRILIMATIKPRFSGDLLPMLEQLNHDGWVRLFHRDRIVDIRELLRDVPKRRRPADVDVVVDRLVIRADGTARLGEAVESAARAAEGRVKIAVLSAKDTWKVKRFAAARVCTECGHVCPEPSPKLFSHNAPEGACETCNGLGHFQDIDPNKLLGDPILFVAETIPALAGLVGITADDLRQRVAGWPFELASTRWSQVPEQLIAGLMDGTPDQPGLLELTRQRLAKTRSKAVAKRLESLKGERPCPDCEGRRLNPDAANVRVGNTTLPGLLAMDVSTARAWFERLDLPRNQAEVVADVLTELRERLAFLERIRLDYLTLNRPAHTLSGGEAQRARLTTQLGSSLEGVTYILDEPTTGLHQADSDRLVDLLHELRDAGNTVVVVEHDEDVMRRCDHLVELGPGAGREGGQLVWSGPLSDLANAKGQTAAFLRGEQRVTPWRIRRPTESFLEIREARIHNLQRVRARIPLGALTAVTGLSGAGKSSLVKGCLLTAVQAHHQRRAVPPGTGAVLNAGRVDRAILVDTRPLGKGPRSVPATFTKAFDPIRELYAALPEAKIRGFKADRFSFNTAAGRCPACEGQGVTKVSMHFMPDVFVTCERCNGMRFNRETLAVRYRDRSIGQVLQMTVAQALKHFRAIDQIVERLQPLADLGLGYLQLGQASQHLSGGEAQRIKLAAELGRPAKAGRTLYVLDEPTSGLHPADVEILLRVLKRLVQRGDTVVVIEHQLDVIAAADWVIDLGPGAGSEGGSVVAEGPPEAIATNEASVTGRYLAPLLARD